MGYCYLSRAVQDRFHPIGPGWKAGRAPFESFFGPTMDLSPTASRFDHLVLGPVKRGVVVYVCPTCNHQVRTDGEGMGPACTGPTWRDEHPLTPMRKVGKDMERTR